MVIGGFAEMSEEAITVSKKFVTENFSSQIQLFSSP
jgi:hypothetical protein